MQIVITKLKLMLLQTVFTTGKLSNRLSIALYRLNGHMMLSFAMSWVSLLSRRFLVMLGFIFLHMLMYAADIYLWQHYRINYPFIFGFKSGTELGYREVLLITTGISLFSLAGIISNLQMETEKLSTIAESIPLVLVSVR
eukprot:Gb_36223 [translate_table: standard]